MTKCRIILYSVPMTDWSGRLHAGQPPVSQSKCEEHDWMFRPGEPAWEGKICPVGRIEAATEKAIAKLQPPDLQTSAEPSFTHSTATYPPAEMTECAKQLAVAKAYAESLKCDLSIAQLQLARIADEVVDPGLDEAGLRQAIANIRYIINPAM